MAPRIDLTGQTFGSWEVLAKGAAVKRAAMWTCQCSACGELSDLPGTALKGKTFPPCPRCTPAADLPAVSFGMHLECRNAHLVGTPCPTGKPAPAYTVTAVGPTHGEDLGGIVIRRVSAQSLMWTHPDASRLPEPGTFGDMVRAAGGWLDGASIWEHPDADRAAESADRFSEGWAARAAALATDRPRLVVHSEVLGPPIVSSFLDSEPNPFATTVAERSEPHGNQVPPGAQLRADVMARIATAMEGYSTEVPEGLTPSSPGASSLGGCERKLAHRLAFGKPPWEPSWPARVGTAVHDWLERVFGVDSSETLPDGSPRWLSGYWITDPITCPLDLHDCLLSETVDFKVVGATTLKKARKGIVAENYQTQTQLLGLGVENDGFRVDRVSLLFLPTSVRPGADWREEAVWWTANYDRGVALAAIARRDNLQVALASGVDPAAVLAGTSISEDYCDTCPALGEHCIGARPAPAPRPETFTGNPFAVSR